MTNRVVVGALMGALLVFATGCEEECVDTFDCINKQGAPPEGKAWTCEDNACVTRDIPAPTDPGDAGTDPGDAGTDPADSGTQTDAGTDAGTTQPDAGTDAGMEMDAGTDAGMEMDAGTDAGMNVGQGGACTASTDCMAGLRCEGTATKTCAPLHVAMTLVGGTATTSKAVAVRHNDPDAANIVSLGTATDSYFPRWSADGNSVAFVEAITGGTQLATLTVPPATATLTPIIGSSAAGTDIFPHLEWEPSSFLAWSRKKGQGYSGISIISTAAGASVQSITADGVVPSWARDGNTFAYNSGTTGLFTAGPNAAATQLAGGEAGEEPHHNRANNWVVFQKSAGIDGDITKYELYTLPTGATGTPTATKIAALGTPEAVTVNGKTGEIRSYATLPNWSPDGAWVAYVRVYYSFYDPPQGQSEIILCENAASLCPNRPPNDIFLQRINATDGSAQGGAVRLVEGGTLPSFSPDGRFVAYIRGRRLYVQEIDPATGGTGGRNPIIHTNTGDVRTNLGDDHRPRWQPR
jgi:Tol biopolymer transport system component